MTTIKKINWLLIAPFALLIGFLGALGGSQNSSLLIRRLGISLITTGYVYFQFLVEGYSPLCSLWALTTMLVYVILTIGYGVPDEWDEGSTLGKFYYQITRQNVLYTNILTRGTIGLLLALSLLVVPIMLENWLVYGVYGIGITLTWALITWRGWGSWRITVKNKLYEFCVSDCVSYALLGIFYYIIITWR